MSLLAAGRLHRFFGPAKTPSCLCPKGAAQNCAGPLC